MKVQTKPSPTKKDVRVHYKGGNKSLFSAVLRDRVNDYFSTRSKYADWRMVTKMVIVTMILVGTYVAIISGQFSHMAMLGLAMFYGLMVPVFLFNVGHDASHGAFSSNKKVNECLNYSWNLMGTSSYLWTLKHNVSHHAYTNVAGGDVDIDQGFFFRFHPFTPRKKHHRYQHLYAPLLYGIWSLYFQFFREFELMTLKKIGNRSFSGHPRREWIILIVTKLVYVGYALMIPFLVLDLLWWELLIGFVAMHLVAGNFTIFSLVSAHINFGTHFHEPDEDGAIDGNWSEHQLESTIDFASNNRFLSGMLGGLNLHVCHHLLPQICHIHYFDLTKIIRETAQEFDLDYKNVSYWRIIKGHLAFLKMLGREDGQLEGKGIGLGKV
ncbi:MAG: acyl-CoA desaturase [Bacteroidia bacterium]|nr:acyl-CoA desaturase [Bacteroidia bacterium]